MENVIDFGVKNFGINTLNNLGIELLIKSCGGEQAIIDQIREAQHSGLLDRRIADACKSKIRNVYAIKEHGKYKKVKIRGVGLVPYDLLLNYESTPYSYRCWTHILERCINPIGRWVRFYKDCKICDEWLDYGVFREWYDKQIGHDLKHSLDKDLLGNGKLYSPETCCLLPQELNAMIVSKKNKSDGLPMGVSKRCNKFISVANTGNSNKNGKAHYLGAFNTPEEASAAFWKFKSKRIAETAQSYYDKGELDERAYKALINFKVK